MATPKQKSNTQEVFLGTKTSLCKSKQVIRKLFGKMIIIIGPEKTIQDILMLPELALCFIISNFHHHRCQHPAGQQSHVS